MKLPLFLPSLFSYPFFPGLHVRAQKALRVAAVHEGLEGEKGERERERERESALHSVVKRDEIYAPALGI